MTLRTTSAALGALLLAVTLVSCAASPEETATPTPDAPRPTPTVTAPPIETAAPVATGKPACDTIVSTGTVAALTEEGWTFEEQPFVIGDVTLDQGLLCFWADFTVASDHGQLYGWSEISPEDATQTQTSLLGEGWMREDGPDGIYITENPQFAMGTDEDGYGMTYLFGDGWVKFADTRQGLILIEWAA